MKFQSSAQFAAAALVLAIAAGCGGTHHGEAGSPPVGSPPANSPPGAFVVIGQADFDDGEPPPNGPTIPLERLINPEGGVAVTADGRLFVGDSRNVKTFAGYENASGSAAQLAIPGAARHLSIQAGRLVASQDNRVEIYSTLPTDSNAIPDIQLGGPASCSPNGFNTPGAGFITPGGRLIVADTLNNRVLIWAQGPAEGAAPNFVVGQRDMVSCEADAINDDGTADGNGTSSAQTLNNPTSVWSDDNRLVVVDRGNSRVLIWDAFPDGNFRPASRVIGQASFIDGAANLGLINPSDKSLSTPTAVDVREDGQLAVADTGNNRVLVWDTFPASDGQAATRVIGQSGFAGGSGNAGNAVPAANTLKGPTGVRFDRRNLLITDTGNHRVLVFASDH